jgi:hypothetical protein
MSIVVVFILVIPVVLALTWRINNDDMIVDLRHVDYHNMIADIDLADEDDRHADVQTLT